MGIIGWSERSPARLKSVWLTFASDLVVEYRFGAEQDPSNPFGHVALTVFGNGDVTVSQHRHGNQRRWSGHTTRQAIDWILDLLNAAGFPLVADHAIPPGATRRLQVTLGGRTYQTSEIAYYVPSRMPAYQLLFQLLDELVTAATDHAVPIVQAPRAGLLSDG